MKENIYFYFNLSLEVFLKYLRGYIKKAIHIWSSKMGGDKKSESYVNIQALLQIQLFRDRVYDKKKTRF